MATQNLVWRHATANVGVPLGMPAYAGATLDTTCNRIWLQPITVVSQIFGNGADEAPATLDIGAWAAVTSNIRSTACKLRADLPLQLQDASLAAGTPISGLLARGKVVLCNGGHPSSETIEQVWIYQGDPATAATNWVIKDTNTITIPIDAAHVVRMEGYVNPSWLHGIKLTNNDGMNAVFVDIIGGKPGRYPLIKFVELVLIPFVQVDDTKGITAPSTPGAATVIGNTQVRKYSQDLESMSAEMANFCHGSLGPVHQRTGNDVYGYEHNLALQGTAYSLMTTLSNTTTNGRGSMWIPLDGKLTKCSDGKYRARVRCSWQGRVHTGTSAVTHDWVIYPPYTHTGVLMTSTRSYTYDVNVNYTRDTWFDLVLDAPLAGVGIAMRATRTAGGSVSRPFFVSLLSYKIVPFVA